MGGRCKLDAIFLGADEKRIAGDLKSCDVQGIRKIWIQIDPAILFTRILSSVGISIFS